MKILVTGAAGFIGFHTSKTLLEENHHVIGIDNLNTYYDINLKLARLNLLKEKEAFEFIKLDIADRNHISQLFQQYQFDIVIHLAAQAGVRYSIENPYAYIDSNLVGFGNLLENCRQAKIQHFIYASSSSVYGANTKQPFSESDNVDHPLALYAATKKSNELMAHSYANLYNLPCTGLRFFTVYGPWGRPDMALFKFVKNILADQPIDVYNHGKMERDFTYIDDVVAGIVRLAQSPATPDTQWNSHSPNPSTSFAPYRIYNIGNGKPVDLMDYIQEIEKCLGKQAKIHFMGMQDGDVPKTWSDCSQLQESINYSARTDIQTGIKSFIAWYQNVYLKEKQPHSF